MNKINKRKLGFTLIELLVVISIMGILTVISLSTFTSAQVKARDSQRKSDLDGISKALMMYYNDNNVFPVSFPFGNEAVGFIGTDGTVYMRKAPQELKSGWSDYVYEVSASGKSFNLFANLENRKDSQCLQDQNGDGIWVRSGDDYCYGVASPNTIIGTTLP